MFTQNLKTKFTFSLGRVMLSQMTLVQVDSQNPAGAKVSPNSTRDCFSLTFRGPADLALRQDTYTVQHAKLGRFSLFIVPGDADRTARQYVAIINRLNP
jgi:hypothetical protein